MVSFAVAIIVASSGVPIQFSEPVSEIPVATHEEGSCHDVDFEIDECASERVTDVMVAAPRAIVDCEDPLIAEMIGSCDLPAPAIPSLHIPTLRTGSNDFVVAARDGSTQRLTNCSSAPSLDGALTLAPLALAPFLNPAPLAALASDVEQDVSAARLDRPPRA